MSADGVYLLGALLQCFALVGGVRPTVIGAGLILVGAVMCGMWRGR